MKFRFFQIHFGESIILLHFSLLRRNFVKKVDSKCCIVKKTI